MKQIEPPTCSLPRPVSFSRFCRQCTTLLIRFLDTRQFETFRWTDIILAALVFCYVRLVLARNKLRIRRRTSIQETSDAGRNEDADGVQSEENDDMYELLWFKPAGLSLKLDKSVAIVAIPFLIWFVRQRFCTFLTYVSTLLARM